MGMTESEGFAHTSLRFPRNLYTSPTNVHRSGRASSDNKGLRWELVALLWVWECLDGVEDKRNRRMLRRIQGSARPLTTVERRSWQGWSGVSGLVSVVVN